MWVFENEINWPTIKITPEEIFQGKIPALNVNFITEPSASLDEEYAKREQEIKDQIAKLDPSSDTYADTKELLEKRLAKNEDEKQDLALTTDGTQRALVSLRNTISSWYMTLRNIAIVGLLCVLVYVGIRMMLCSVASEKAKYKQMFMDWVVALALIFFLHIIMSLTMTVTEKITEIFSSSSVVGIKIMPEDQGLKYDTVNNLMEYARLYVNLADASRSLSFLIVYVWLVGYTVKFIITYVKRFIHMAFLTMIAPLVALTYPIDKISDGKAQAFDMWLKDYIFNALIQPFHLIIYTVFVSSAIEFATTNLIYACVAIGFISQAEKFMRKMFGFDKAPNPADSNGSFAGGAIAAGAFNKLRSGIGSGSGKEDSANGKPPRTQPSHEGSVEEAQMLDGGNNNDNNNQSDEQRNLPEGENPQEQQQGDDNAQDNSDGIDSYSTGEFDDYGYSGLESGNETEDDADDNVDTVDESDTPQIDTSNETGENNPPQNNGAPNPSEENNPPQSQNGNPTRTRRNNGNEKKEKRKIRGFSGAGNVFAKRWKGMARAGLAATGSFAGATLGALYAGLKGESMLKGAMMGGATGAVLGHKSLDATIGAGKSIANAGRRIAYDYRAAYNKEYADKIKEKGDFMRDKRQKEFIKQNFTQSDGSEIKGKELKQKMEQSYAVYQAGIVDEKTRKKVMNLEDQINDEILKRLDENEKNNPEQIAKTRELARNQALITNELASQFGAKDILKDGEKIKANIYGNIESEARKQGQNLSQQQLQAMTNKQFERLAEWHTVSMPSQTPRNQDRNASRTT